MKGDQHTLQLRDPGYEGKLVFVPENIVKSTK